MKDGYGRAITYLRLSVTELCNLRCRYCMPADGVCKKHHEEMLTEDEMILAVKAGASLGIRKLRITGGEPLVKQNIVSICRRAKEVDGIAELCVTTNGCLLPELGRELRAAGVDRINLSLDTLRPDRYTYITRIGTLKQALSGLEAALSLGFQRIKVNTVLIGGFNEDEIVDLAELTRELPVDVRFIELMPMYDSGDFGPEAYLPCSEVLRRLPQAEAQAYDGSVARLYRLPGAKGNIGLISPVSDHFCALCNRIRLTADGKLKPCLHSSEEYPIKGLEFEEMVEQMKRAIFAKPDCHAELSAYKRSGAGRNMNQIGG
ncbi:MAG: GTP 3',8-cyclase MoaA [Lawsonibacter sp.]|jgi:cyclic pyranopterin phosphate synthase